MTPSPVPRSLIAYNGYDSGLGNRVRVVLGAKSLAELEGRRFAYVWPTGKLFGPRFSDLWHYRGLTVPRAVSRALAYRYPYVDESLTWLDDRKRTETLWQIRTGSPLRLPPEARPWQDELRALTPVPEVAGAVTRFYDENLRGEPYIGVMIRAHAVSHARTREASPVEWYLRRMAEIVERDPGTRFFLSCDVPEVQRRVMDAFPTCVAQQGKGGYNSVAGVRSALVDLYLLACSGYILGPYFSSFVHLAEHLAGDRLTFETSVVESPGTIDAAAAGLAADPLRPFERL
ncbi:hypothetical protein [Cellulomonas aerilata]|uniref:Uncharacterized protein n=1 Tax=Cellulomonas aerilata TaxID=515326 RepID=A0A512DDT9_9CELL|nr:hypothetical protein [Cellulomonas aerilata]GEO34632.1 hypothetical protein CAE01nite_23570 [Cellulomonas aerilata]